MKMLVWVLLAVVVFWWLTRSKKASQQPQPSAKASTGKPPAVSETMVSCAHCGTYVPSSECVTSPAGASYCSKEHLALHASSRTRA